MAKGFYGLVGGALLTDKPIKGRNISMENNQYQCLCCKGIFEKGWSDEEAIKEMEENNFDSYSPEELAIVCDDCYKKIMIHNKA